MSVGDIVALGVGAACATAIIYTHIGYPLVLRALAGAKPPQPLEHGDPTEWPRIDLIIPAHNEAAVIEAKIENLARLDYPSERLTIILALDGCTDETEALARSKLAALGDPPRIVIRATEKNAGKVAVLNREIAAARGDIVALSDASALVEPDALKRAARHFQDAKVGVVCAAYRLVRAGSSGEAAYWRYQNRIKADEAALGAPMGAHGAFYLFRRKFWTPLPPETINDDFILPMRIVEAGGGAVYDPGIVATELETTTARQEFWRRMRIGAGNMQQLLMLKTLRSPRLGWIAFMFLSGKGLRPLVPFLTLSCVGAAAWLAMRGYLLFHAALVCGGLTAALLAIAAARKDWSWPKPIRVLAYAAEGYAASFAGALSYLITGRAARWSAPNKIAENNPEG